MTDVRDRDTQRREGVLRVLEALPWREAVVLKCRFGFDGHLWEHDEIATELAISREEVIDLEIRGLSRLAALRELATLPPAPKPLSLVVEDED